MATEKKIGVIGCGSMGSALVTGLLSSGYNPTKLHISNPRLEKLLPLEQMGVHLTLDNCKVAKRADVVFIAVKPWVLPEVCEQIVHCLDLKKQSVCVIVYGVKLEEIRRMLELDGIFPGKLSIAMPNTAMRVGKSMTFIVGSEDAISQPKAILRIVGKVMTVPEDKLPAATQLASCGIAYAMRYVRAAMEGGVQLGFKASEAQEVIVETLLGAAKLLEGPDKHPETEIDKVTTPGGLTIKGLNAMEKAGFSAAVMAGLLSGN